MQRFLKRVLDLVIAIAGLLFCALPWLVIAVLIKLDSNGPVFFLQERAGKDNKPFMIYKFRTMTVGADKEGFYTGEGDARITKVGNFLRKTSFDELPQLINIFLGEMSVVGPRPEEASSGSSRRDGLGPGQRPQLPDLAAADRIRRLVRGALVSLAGHQDLPYDFRRLGQRRGRLRAQGKFCGERRR